MPDRRNQYSEETERMGETLRRGFPADVKPELMMPVTDENALRQFQIEALRQITDNLKRLNDKMDKQGDELRSIDARLIRIESNSVSASVQKLQEEVGDLRAEKFRRDGALGLFQWTFKNWPGVIGFFALVALILKSTGRI